jgi:hypothetical protein
MIHPIHHTNNTTTEHNCYAASSGDAVVGVDVMNGSCLSSPSPSFLYM